MSCTNAPNNNGGVTFSCSRLLNTGDSKDFVMPFDQELVMSYATRQDVNYFGKHSSYGFYNVNFNSDGTILTGSADAVPLSDSS